MTSPLLCISPSPCSLPRHLHCTSICSSAAQSELNHCHLKVVPVPNRYRGDDVNSLSSHSPLTTRPAGRSLTQPIPRRSVTHPTPCCLMTSVTYPTNTQAFGRFGHPPYTLLFDDRGSVSYLGVRSPTQPFTYPPNTQPFTYPPNTQAFGLLPNQHPAVHLPTQPLSNPVKAANRERTGRPLCGVPFVGHNLTNPVSDCKSSHTIEANNQLQAPLSVLHLPPLVLRSSPSRVASNLDIPAVDESKCFIRSTRRDQSTKTIPRHFLWYSYSNSCTQNGLMIP